MKSHQPEQPTVIQSVIPPPLPQHLRREGMTAKGTIQAADAATYADKQASGKHPVWRKLPTVLRWLGATTLAVATLSFLVSGWIDASPLLRYYQFLGFAMVLTAAGFFCAIRWRDDKGARTFMALATAFIPAHFAQLGGMIYAEAMGMAAAFSRPFALFQFDPVGFGMLFPAILAGLPILALVAFSGFSAMARLERGRLTTLYLAVNAPLLLPSRESAVIAFLAGLSLASLFYFDRRYFSRRPTLRSWDGIAVRFMLCGPPVLLVLRNLLLHDIAEVLISFLYACWFGVMFMALPKTTKSIGVQKALQALSLFPAFMAWAHLIRSMGYTDLSVYHEAWVPLVVLPFSVMVGALSFFSVGSGRRYRRLAAGLAVFSMLFHLFAFGTTLTAVGCILISITVLAAAFVQEEKGLLYIGITGLITGLVKHLHFAIDIYQQNVWLSLAITGVAVLLIASFIERHGPRTLAAIHDIRGRLQGWD